MSDVATLEAEAKTHLGNLNFPEAINRLKAASSLAALDGDYATAARLARSAKGVLSGTPDSQNSGKTGTMITWRGEEIDSFIKMCERKLALGSGIQTTNVIYQNPTE